MIDEANDGGTRDNYDLMLGASSLHDQLDQKLLELIATAEEHVAAGAKVYCKASFGI